MKTDFRPELMTKDIVYCLRSECNRSATCLRYLAYKHSQPFFRHSFIDPRSKSIGDQCEEYLSNEVQRMGRGFKKSIRLVQYGSIASFQARLTHQLGCGRSQYYRYAAGKYPLTLDQQMRIRKEFKEFGVTDEDLFDSYEEAYFLPY